MAGMIGLARGLGFAEAGAWRNHESNNAVLLTTDRLQTAFAFFSSNPRTVLTLAYCSVLVNCYSLPVLTSAIMSTVTESLSSSRDLSSSLSSLNQSNKRSSSEISKVYKHASQLFLTRRLLESYEALQPVITPPNQSNPDDSPALAPIATATTSQRIKIWSLYVTLLNSILELGDAEGKQVFGSKEYREIVRRVQNGDIWEQVVKDGYHNREGSVDAEVVYNLYGQSFHVPVSR